MVNQTVLNENGHCGRVLDVMVWSDAGGKRGCVAAGDSGATLALP